MAETGSSQLLLSLFLLSPARQILLHILLSAYFLLSLCHFEESPPTSLLQPTNLQYYMPTREQIYFMVCVQYYQTGQWSSFPGLLWNPWGPFYFAWPGLLPWHRHNLSISAKNEQRNLHGIHVAAKRKGCQQFARRTLCVHVHVLNSELGILHSMCNESMNHLIVFKTFLLYKFIT